MRNLVIGFVVGLVVASVGVSGIVRMLDRAAQTIQTQSKELAQWNGQTQSKLLQKDLTINCSFAIILICCVTSNMYFNFNLTGNPERQHNVRI